MTCSQPIRLAYDKYEPATVVDENLSPILFLHGATAFKEIWFEIPQVVANATRRLCYSLDARNHGDSEWTDEFNFDVNVDDLLYFMDNLGIEKSILVGHSMGGITAIKTALKMPNRVECIIVEDMSLKKLTKNTIGIMRSYVSLVKEAFENAPADMEEDEAKNFVVEYFKAHVTRALRMIFKDAEDTEEIAAFISLRQGPDGRYVSKCNLEALEKSMQNCDTLVSHTEGRFDGPACFIYGKLSPLSVMKPVKLSYTCCEPEENVNVDAPPIILHHGFTRCKERWKPIQQSLADKTKRLVYAVDARNHGSSEKSDFFNFNILANDLEHFMEQKNIPKASMIGHSMGGIVMMILALRAPEKVEKLIIEDVSPKEFQPELYYVFSAMIQEQMKCFEQSTSSDTEGTMNQKLRETIFRTVPMIPDSDHEVIQEMEFPIKKCETGYESKTHLSSLLKALQNPPICDFPKDKSYNGSVLFIYGGQSNFCVLDDKDIILKYFPRAQFSCFEDAGHEICARYPEKFLEEVLQFLSN